MKKHLFLFSVSLTFLLFACDKNSDSPNAQGDLTEQWNLIKSVYVDTSTKNEDVEPYDEGSYLRFDDNGICYSHVDGDDNSSNWHYIDDGKGILIDNSSGFEANDSGYATLLERDYRRGRAYNIPVAVIRV